MFLYNKQQLLIRYTLLDAHSPTVLRLKPFGIQKHPQPDACQHGCRHFSYRSGKGVGYRLYGGFPYVYMQLSVQNEFVKVPDWYRNIEYLKEKERGYDYREDLFVPGYFECPIKKGKALFFSASLTPVNPSRLTAAFRDQLDKRPVRDTFKNCLKIAASQFLIDREDKLLVMEGYPWLDTSLRNTAIALPGLVCYAQDGKSLFEHALEALTEDEDKLYHAPDTPLWLFRTLQQYVSLTQDKNTLWKTYGPLLKSILNHYKKGQTKCSCTITVCCGYMKNKRRYAAVIWWKFVLCGTTPYVLHWSCLKTKKKMRLKPNLDTCRH